MKNNLFAKGFIFIEGLLFVLFNIFVFFDMGGIEMYDTCLVEVGPLSSYQGSVPYISTNIFAGILIIGFIIVLLSALRKKVLLPLIIINSIYAVLLLLFYKNEIENYLPFDIIFDKLLVFVLPVFIFIYLSYVTILINLLFTGYFLFKNKFKFYKK